MSLKNLLLVVLACPLLSAQAQTESYPTNIFSSPLRIPIVLAGNYGECRPDHFHSGIDIKTEGKENMPVYAAADGFVDRIKIEKGGYGHALYVRHANDYVTVYGHLNNFAPEIQKFLRNYQYSKEVCEVDLELKADQFPVKKGQQIAWSGNTGSSTAPHLHFEIRNAITDKPFNPLLFGLKINDNIAPIPTKLAVYDLSKGVYEQDPILFSLTKKGDAYYPSQDTIVVHTEQSALGVEVNDFMNGSDNTLAFYKATVFMVDATIISVQMDNIGFKDTRYVNAYMDYKTKMQKDETIQCLFQQEGNYLPNVYKYTSDYRENIQKGKLEMGAGQAKEIRVVMEDASGNKSEIKFYLKYVPTAHPPRMPCEKFFMQLQPNAFSNEHIAVMLNAKTWLYENFCFQYKETPDNNSYSSRHMLHNTSVPVHKPFDIYINPTKDIPEGQTSKIAMVYSDGKTESGKAAIQSDGWYKAEGRRFGEYRLVLDTEPPAIQSMQKDGADLSKAKEISFTVKDAVTSIRIFRAELDGKWLCMEQGHNNIYAYTFDEHCPKGSHTLKITATDENGNSGSLDYSFKR